jgi:hypothetical protein
VSCLSHSWNNMAALCHTQVIWVDYTYEWWNKPHMLTHVCNKGYSGGRGQDSRLANQSY